MYGQPSATIDDTAPSDERNPRVGTWRLNVTKSTFYDGPAPKSELQICEAVSGDGINVKIVRVYSQGNERRSGYTAYYDGKEYPFPGSPWDTIALKRLDRYTSEAVFKERRKSRSDLDHNGIEGWGSPHITSEVNRWLRPSASARGDF